MNPKEEETYIKALVKIEACRKSGEKTLDLSGMGLTLLPPKIGQLTALTELDLENNELTSLPPEIGQLSSLRVLDIINNQLTSLPPEFGQLTALVFISSRNNHLISLPPEFGQLAALRILDLGGNRLRNLPPEIGQLTDLKGLYLYNNQLKNLPPEIGKLTDLRELFLFGNELTNLPAEMSQLTALTMLYLSNNQLTSLPPEVIQLTALKRLSLHNNQLATLPPEIDQLAALTQLYLYKNRLTRLPPEICHLTRLTELDVSENQLDALPPNIGKLDQLRELRLDFNQVTSLPPDIGSLAKLEILQLGNNQVMSLPPTLSGLKSLKELSISDNKLTSLPPEIGQLTALTQLYLDNNQLTSLPPEIEALPKLRFLGIHGNPLPPELLRLSGGSRGQGTKLLRFFRQRWVSQQRGEEPRRFDEGKLLLVGPGEVGKTWLLQALQGKTPIAKGSTKGIEIAREPLTVPHPSGGRILQFLCWDFGGQDHFQVTHQIFFSSRAVYLLVWKPREGFDPEMEARLERIQLSAKDTAKVLIVSTHADGGVPAILGQEALRQRFGDLIWGFYAVDSAKGREGKGIAELKEEIAKAAAQLSGIDETSPLSWHRAQERVRRLRRPAVPFKDFAKTCALEGLEAADADILAQIMEIQGHLVYFPDAAQDEDAGALAEENLVVLQPEWLAKAVGFVIEDDETITAQGILNHASLKRIWSRDEKRDCPGYPGNLRGYLLWLMWKFDIAYKQDGHTSLVPELIARNRPDLLWTPATPTQEPELEATCLFTSEATLKAITPPKGVIPALTAAVHSLRELRDPTDADRLDRNWNSGFFLATAKRGSAFVELVDRELRMNIRHTYPKLLLEQIRKTLQELVPRRWPHAMVDLRIPCPGKVGVHPCPYLFKKTFLDAQEANAEVQCGECSGKFKTAELLYGFRPYEKEVLQKLNNLQEGQQALLAASHAIFMALDPEGEERRRGPNLFTILPAANSLTHEKIRVNCWCEHPDGPHPVVKIGDGTPPEYVLSFPKGWLVKIAPYISWTVKLMKAFLPLGVTSSDFISAEDQKAMVELSKAVAVALPTGELDVGAKMELDPDVMHRRPDRDYPGSQSPEITALRHLHDLLEEQVKKPQRWGNLKPVLTKQGEILWLCPKHAEIQEPSPEKI